MSKIKEEELREACRALPLFPLPGVAFFPHTLLPLHVFEPRYQALVRDLQAGNGLLAIPQLAPGWEESYEDRPAVYPIAGMGRIVRHEALPEGRSNILIVGLGRIGIVEELDGDLPYRVARVDLLSDIADEESTETGVVISEIRAVLGQVVRSGGPGARDLAPLLDGERTGAEIVDVLAHVLLRDPVLRQEYLELPSMGARGAAVLERLMATCFSS